MASDLRMDVQPYGDGRVLLTIGGLSMTLEADAADKLREVLGRAAMPGQPAPDVHGPHECSFPCNPPGGTFWNPGPCKTCGKPYVVAQAEAQLAEAQAALAEAHAVAERRAEAGRRDGHGEADGG